MSDDLVDLLLNDDPWSDSPADLLSVAPDLTIREAYQLQFEQMRRRAAAGDSILGYKASATSRSARAMLPPDTPSPAIGTVLASRLAHDGVRFTVRPGATYVEVEIAAVLDSDLAGAHVTRLDAARAIGWLCPALDIAAWGPTAVAGRRSTQHAIATNKTAGLVVLGSPRPFTSVPDLRLEGAILEINGEPVGSGTGVEVMGHPLEVVAAIARNLAGHGLGLGAGMIVITGSLLAPFTLPPDGVSAHATFTTLGGVSARFTAEHEPTTAR
jgi:2-keto-4-pentenoate hydratase